ncbi:hypothetical protein FGO68_gene1468 [Halteria grandinella]|uniref:Uncharacterized protein n=1 Tax=Halteria grandinella TaxID=5974 RepID=A0A8J8NEN9_HALGN|nr:hypothetical protein FGO68_gene1468 [Halteria grandinella]
MNKYLKENKMDLYNSNTLRSRERGVELVSFAELTNEEQTRVYRQQMTRELKTQDQDQNMLSLGTVSVKDGERKNQGFLDKGIKCSLMLPKRFKRNLELKYNINERGIEPFFTSKIEIDEFSQPNTSFEIMPTISEAQQQTKHVDPLFKQEKSDPTTNFSRQHVRNQIFHAYYDKTPQSRLPIQLTSKSQQSMRVPSRNSSDERENRFRKLGKSIQLSAERFQRELKTSREELSKSYLSEMKNCIRDDFGDLNSSISHLLYKSKALNENDVAEQKCKIVERKFDKKVAGWMRGELQAVNFDQQRMNYYAIKSDQ